jgi:hypothetical protein
MAREFTGFGIAGFIEVDFKSDLATITRAEFAELTRRGARFGVTAIDQVLTDIQFVQAVGSMVGFEMLRTDARGQLSYLVRFVVDEDGIWRLRDM